MRVHPQTMLRFQLFPNTLRSRAEHKATTERSALWRRLRSSRLRVSEIGILVYRPTSIPRLTLCCSPKTLLKCRACHSPALDSPQVLPTWRGLQGSKVLSFAPVTNVSCVAEQPQLALDRRSYGLFCLY